MTKYESVTIWTSLTTVLLEKTEIITQNEVSELLINVCLSEIA